MYCLERCFHLESAHNPEPEDITLILNHGEASHIGHNFYFCAVHRAYHCMLVDDNLDQPLCGECAAFYYQNCLSVVWEEDYDMPAAPEGSHRDAIVNRLIEMDPWIQASHDVDNLPHLPPPGADASEFFLLLLPRAEDTLQGLGDVQLYNPRQDLFRLMFRSPTGAIGWMPCGPDIGARAEFIHLTEHERGGDVVFKRIRLWACKMQGYDDLPKEIRWCLWASYMLCTEALYDKRDVDEAEIWIYRREITILYDILHILFHMLQVPVPHPMPALTWRSRRP
ncbi:hypothetical protein HDV63DRAFT_416994 [Trichoderma sp. SZMC 28014]